MIFLITYDLQRQLCCIVLDRLPVIFLQLWRVLDDNLQLEHCFKNEDIKY